MNKLYWYCKKNIGVHKSAIPRELKRNSEGENGCYLILLAEKKSEERHVNIVKNLGFIKEIKAFVI